MLKKVQNRVEGGRTTILTWARVKSRGEGPNSTAGKSRKGRGKNLREGEERRKPQFWKGDFTGAFPCSRGGGWGGPNRWKDEIRLKVHLKGVVHG